jgi:hypothetical protein
MGSIPAASLAGVDLIRIRREHKEIASELEHLGSLMVRGLDTPQEFLQLCQLLIACGERAIGKELLLANCGDDDACQLLFRSEFPEVEDEFNKSVKAFKEQFHCELHQIRTGRHLSNVYTITASENRDSADLFGDMLKANSHFEVQITYEVDGHIVADLCSLLDPLNAVPLEFIAGSWRPEIMPWSSDV